MVSTLLRQDAYNLPEYLARKLLAWKIQYGGLYLAPFRAKTLNSLNQLVNNDEAPWTICVLRELVLKEYIAYAELTEFSPSAAAYSLVRTCLLVAYDYSVGREIDISDSKITLDFLFGQLMEISGFFKGNSMIAQRSRRDKYGAGYHIGAIDRLVVNVGYKPDELMNLTDTDLAERWLVYNKQSRQMQQITRTGNAAQDRQNAKAALVQASEHASTEALADRMARTRDGRSERINPDRENVELLRDFAGDIKQRPIPDVTKLKRWDRKKDVPDFSGKKR